MPKTSSLPEEAVVSETSSIAEKAASLVEDMKQYSSAEDKINFLAGTVGKSPEISKRIANRCNYIVTDKKDKVYYECSFSENAFDENDAVVLRNFYERTHVSPLYLVLSAASEPRKQFARMKSGEAEDSWLGVAVKFEEGREGLGNSGGGDLIDVGVPFWTLILKNLERSGPQAFEDTHSLVESHFFHEYVHVMNGEYNNNNTEEYTQLGQFLWAPKANWELGAFKSYIDGYFLSGWESLDATYGRPFVETVSKILINDLHERKLIAQVPNTREEILKILQSLDKYYETMDREERIKLLEQYLSIGRQELDFKVQEITRNLELPY